MKTPLGGVGGTEEREVARFDRTTSSITMKPEVPALRPLDIGRRFNHGNAAAGPLASVPQAAADGPVFARTGQSIIRDVTCEGAEMKQGGR